MMRREEGKDEKEGMLGIGCEGQEVRKGWMRREEG